MSDIKYYLRKLYYSNFIILSIENVIPIMSKTTPD